MAVLILHHFTVSNRMNRNRRVLLHNLCVFFTWKDCLVNTRDVPGLCLAYCSWSIPQTTLRSQQNPNNLDSQNASRCELSQRKNLACVVSHYLFGTHSLLWVVGGFARHSYLSRLIRDDPLINILTIDIFFSVVA